MPEKKWKERERKLESLVCSSCLGLLRLFDFYQLSATKGHLLFKYVNIWTYFATTTKCLVCQCKMEKLMEIDHAHTLYTHLHELESVKNFARPLYRCVRVCVSHCISVCRCVSLVIVANLVTNKHILYVLSRFFFPPLSPHFVSTWTHGLCAWPPVRVATYGDAIKGETERRTKQEISEEKYAQELGNSMQTLWFCSLANLQNRQIFQFIIKPSGAGKRREWRERGEGGRCAGRGGCHTGSWLVHRKFCDGPWPWTHTHTYTRVFTFTRTHSYTHSLAHSFNHHAFMHSLGPKKG